jgi:hypothetical protein
MPRINRLEDIPAIRDYLGTIGAEGRSLRSAVVRDHHGSYWTDTVTLTLDTKTGAFSTKPEWAHYLPGEDVAKEIAKQCEDWTWPDVKRVARWLEADMPVDLREADPERVYTFYDTKGNIIMKQIRTDKVQAGEKSYVPFTLWDDDVIRMMEPDGLLPMWGLEQLNTYSTVFLHEGAKAARKMARLVEGKTQKLKDEFKRHPWYRELKDAAHLGWIGGADNPNRTDWKVLKNLGVTKVFIVGDNDPKGKRAVQLISRHLEVPTYSVEFSDQWPSGFDLADEWPKTLFNDIDGAQFYVGPTFRAALQPATFATRPVIMNGANGKPLKPVQVLRDHFKDMWVYVPNNDIFVCVDFPEKRYQEAIANKVLNPFSDHSNTAQLITKAYTGTHTKLTYRPDIEARLIIDRDTSGVNLHTPTLIRAEHGDPKPWLDFLAYMFPHEHERKEVERWCATLISRVNVRMEYGLLLVSEAQGIGKTTLGQRILSPLVGVQNAGFPSEAEIVESNFNGWLANKRLIVIGEIYSGHSWKAYNKLKSYITDRDVEVNEKYQRPYKVENWAHIIACSNSKKALRIEEDDRRWFYPEVTEVRWPKKKFDAFNKWLEGGGLQIIKSWADNYGSYVQAGERAPMTERKKALIADSRSEAQKEVLDLAKAMCMIDEPVALAMKDIEGWVRTSSQSKVFDSDLELRKAMQDGGVFTYGKRLTIAGRTQYVIVNPKLWSLGQALEDADFVELIRASLKSANDILGSAM